VKIAVASDHAGLDLKTHIIVYLESNGYDFTDLGTHSQESVDYPDFAFRLCAGIQNGQFDRGVLICGTGIGMSMAANRFVGVRAALCTHVTLAELARKHNNANVLALGGRMTGIELARKIMDVFLATDFLGDRHSSRVSKLDSFHKTNKDSV